MLTSSCFIIFMAFVLTCIEAVLYFLHFFGGLHVFMLLIITPWHWHDAVSDQVDKGSVHVSVMWYKLWPTWRPNSHIWSVEHRNQALNPTLGKKLEGKLHFRHQIKKEKLTIFCNLYSQQFCGKYSTDKRIGSWDKFLCIEKDIGRQWGAQLRGRDWTLGFQPWHPSWRIQGYLVCITLEWAYRF